MKSTICMIFFDIMIWFEMLENFEDWLEEVNNLHDMIMSWGLHFWLMHVILKSKDGGGDIYKCISICF